MLGSTDTQRYAKPRQTAHRSPTVNTELIRPNWPAPKHIKAYSTTRHLATSATGSISATGMQKYPSFNLALHVNDHHAQVARNRALLAEHLQLPNAPVWLNQVHGTTVVDLDRKITPTTLPKADGSYTRHANQICVIMSADCLPILLTDTQGTQVAALHAGWRGLASGIIENLLKKWPSPLNRVIAWLGPAIGPASFEVGAEVRQAFITQDSDAKKAFHPSHNEKWLANLYLLAKQRLKSRGINHIYGGDYCTFNESSRFFSYRREGQTGRMASLIWKSDH